jgi:hypothetical protein
MSKGQGMSIKGTRILSVAIIAANLGVVGFGGAAACKSAGPTPHPTVNRSHHKKAKRPHHKWTPAISCKPIEPGKYRCGK